MQELDDMELLRRYAQDNSEDAFAILVKRRVNLVYSTALRHVGSTHHAEEITQAVFVILAKKGRGLRPGTIVSGWLYHATRLTAANFLRGEIQRTRREQEAHMQFTLNEPETEVWTQIRPLLDSAMADLNEKDRNAIVLRYFDGRNLRDIGAALGASEDAAKKRVNRAVEKLRKFFVKRGVISTTAIIAGAISAHSVQAAPVTLAHAVTAAALAQGATATASTLTLIKGALKLMAWTKAKTAMIVGACVLLASMPAVIVMEKHIAAQQYVLTREPWSDAGSATPRAALQSLAWAVTHDKFDRAEELMTWDEKGLQYISDPALQRQVTLAVVLAPAVKDIESFKILSIQPTTQPNEVRVNLLKTFKNDNIVPFAVTALLRRAGGRWHIVGNLEYYENNTSSMRLPFTGSF